MWFVLVVRFPSPASNQDECKSMYNCCKFDCSCFILRIMVCFFLAISLKKKTRNWNWFLFSAVAHNNDPQSRRVFLPYFVYSQKKSLALTLRWIYFRLDTKILGIFVVVGGVVARLMFLFMSQKPTNKKKMERSMLKTSREKECVYMCACVYVIWCYFQKRNSTSRRRKRTCENQTQRTLYP